METVNVPTTETSRSIAKLETLIADTQALIAFLKKVDGKIEVSSWPYECISVTGVGDDKKAFSKAVRVLSSNGGGKLEKEYSDHSCTVQRKFGKYVKISATISRDAVCERIVVGTKIVPSYYAPERTEEIVEWKCK